MVYRREDNTVERKIHFYRADTGDDEGGHPLSFDPQPAIDIIAKLPRTGDTPAWYEFESDGNALCLIPYSSSPHPSVRFCRVRRTGLPQLEQAGNITDMNLSPDMGLLESIHVVFFPNNIVGAEYNHFGPRVSRLGSFLHEKSNKDVALAAFRPILRGDATEQLDRLTDLRVLDFSILPSHVEIVRQRNQSLGESFAANRRVLERPKTLHVILKPEQDASTSFLASMKETIAELAGKDDVREGTDRLQVRGKCEDSGRVETIDLLKDQLISTKAIVRMGTRSRALDPASAFGAVRDAYAELHQQLEGAASVSQ